MERTQSAAHRAAKERTLDLKQKLLDPRQRVLLYGTTPPRAGSSEEAVESAAEKLARRLAALPLDGVVVYDIQDESGRTQVPRPFPFTGTVDPRRYSRMLAGRTGRPAITYKCVGGLDEAAWQGWLAEAAREFGVGFVSVVGRPTSGVRYPLALSRAIRLAATHPAQFTVGGVVIAERHTPERSEAARLLAKGIEGCGYFISQTVYSAEASVRLLADYARDCRGAGVAPRRVVLTFSPAGRERTLAFLRWLGVNVPEETARAILGAPSPLAKSIEICRENLARILEHGYAREIPLGVNVESVSINRDEIDASVDLFHALAELLPA
jgi:5,10-methylenetetrahydrofolate reductase